MKAAALAVLLCATSVLAQPSGSESPGPLRKGTWEMGVWVGGGHSVSGGTSDTGIFNLGLRLGRVMTGEHGKGWYRGSLEVATDVIPLHLVFQPGFRVTLPPVGTPGPITLTPTRETVYGAGLNPLITKWNFHGTGNFRPYVELGGGMLVTIENVPEFTYKFNFTPQIALGTHLLRGNNRSLSFDVKYLHISNAGLASLNPGINTVQFSLGYHWFR
ncbi:MAG: acyloxyacyl hydrolase [Acidobacteriales bacterium]|nr:acyloxyacyl hydrolase [Terriglobales bacterium]